MPEDYTPSPPTGAGTDDYRCFLLDPEVASDQFITGFNVLPGNPDVVHHVILFRVPADLVARGRAEGRRHPGPGLDLLRQLRPAQQRTGDRRRALARRLGARRQGRAGLRQGLRRGARQGLAGDHAGALQPARRQGARPQRRRAPARARDPAPPAARDPAAPGAGRAALPARAQRRSALRPRRRPGRRQEALRRRARLRRPTCCTSCAVRSGPGRCSRAARKIFQPRDRPRRGRPHAPAGHVDQGRGQPRHADARTLLDIPVWDFDNQGSRPIKPAVLEPGDTLKVTCRHSQALRDRLPSFEGQPGQVRRLGRGHHRRDVPRDPAGHPSLTRLRHNSGTSPGRSHPSLP